MLKKILILLASALLIIACSKKENQKSIGYSVIDDLGDTIHFINPPQRVITLAPNLTEFIYELNVEKLLVGNTLYCNYPDAAKKIEKVGDLLTFNYEKIVTLKPDLVFITVEGNTKETYDKFKELGLAIFVSNPRNYKGIRKTFLDFGEILGLEDRAKVKVAEWDSVITYVSSSSKNFQQQSAMFLIEIKPIMLVGKSTFLNEYLEFCGLTNIASDIVLNYPVFSREEILRRDPDYIIYPVGDDTNVSIIKNAYPEWKRLNAIRSNKVILVNRDLFSRPGPRFADALMDLFNRLHLQEQKAH